MKIKKSKSGTKLEGKVRLLRNIVSHTFKFIFQAL